MINFSLKIINDVDREICIFAGLMKKANPYEAVIGLEVHAQLSTESNDPPAQRWKIGFMGIVKCDYMW